MSLFAGTGTWPLGVSVPQYTTLVAEKQMIVPPQEAGNALPVPPERGFLEVSIRANGCLLPSFTARRTRTGLTRAPTQVQ